MFHRSTLIGFVGQDPSMRYAPDGTPVPNFSVATRQASARAQPSGRLQGAGRGMPPGLPFPTRHR
jgi:single-stranded DNA-binding protein